jgi:hypothetical protein
LAAEVKAFYDLRYGPISYDFVAWLVRAKLEAKEQKLHVVIVPNEEKLGGFSRHWGKHDEHAARWRLWHIVIASCPLADASMTLAESRNQAIAMRVDGDWWPEGKAHFLRPLVEAAKAGAKVPLLRATEAARRFVASKKPYVTLTLRNQDTVSTRNTDPEIWMGFSDWLTDEKNQRVVILRDSNQALQSAIGEWAEIDPDMRLALYERARMNIIGNNGPQELLKLSGAPYLAFDQNQEPGHFKEYLGLEQGEQLPWATKDQRLVYRAATFDNLCDEFEKWNG